MFSIHGNISDVYSLDSGLPTNRIPVCAQMPENIICYSLNKELSLLLDQNDDAIGNDWRRLAEKVGYGKYIQIWSNSQQLKKWFSPTETILRQIEQERKICSLSDLKELLEEIKRPDAADKTNFHIQLSSLKKLWRNSSAFVHKCN